MLGRIAEWWKRRRQDRREALMPERQVVVSFNDARVSVASPSGETRSIAWDEVQRIAIETTDSGPWGADVWWLLEGPESRVAYPQGASGDPEMLSEYAKRFPGFDSEQVILAMGSTDNARFVCWERS